MMDTNAPSRYSATQFLIALIALLCFSPLFDDFQQGNLVETVLLTVVLLSAIPAAGGRKRTIATAFLLAFPALVGKWLHHFWPDVIPVAVIFASGMIFSAFIVTHHFWFIMRSKVVDSQVLCAGISTFLMLGLLWGFGYLLLDNLSPESFAITLGSKQQKDLSGFVALYFSLGTMSGLGMSDVAPATNFARMLALLESMVAVFYLAILISRLVSMHMEQSHSPEKSGGL